MGTSRSRRAFVAALIAAAVLAYGDGYARAVPPRWQAHPFTAVSHAFAGQLVPLSSTNVWLVGYRRNSISQIFAIAAHRTRAGWKETPLPGTTGGHGSGCCSLLNAAAAVDKTTVWAVGADFTTTPNRALIERWHDGRWTKVGVPNDPNLGDGLQSVSVVSASDVWAVGGDDQGALVEHWDGTSWSIHSAPVVGFSLSSVVALSAGNVWAGGGNGVLYHWDGSTWTATHIPALSHHYLLLDRVPGTMHIWAAAGNSNAGTTAYFDGTGWIVRPLAPGKYSYNVSGIAASRGTAWLVAPINRQRLRTLVEQWTGTRWVHRNVRIHYGDWSAVAHAPGSTRFYAFGKDPGSEIGTYG